MSLMEQYVNGQSTTLNASIISSDTSLVLVSAVGFPTVGQFRIKIGTELIIVGAISGTTCSSLTRAAEGTVAASHAGGDTVTHILTADGLTTILTDRALESASHRLCGGI